MIEDHFWTLIAKKLSGEADEEELRDFEKLLRENPDLHYPLQAITDLWFSDLEFDQQDAQDALKKHIQRMKDLNIEFNEPEEEGQRYETGPRAERKWIWPALAASFFVGTLFFGIRFFSPGSSELKNPLKENKQVVNQISTKNSSKTNLILSDGTKVWLNAGSSLTYDTAYNRVVREVSLTGEAFFDVTKNKTKPFIIHTAKFDIKVLGTEFNVKSYSTDRTTEASLIRGSIEVTFKDNPNRTIILKPNEKLVVNNKSSETSFLKNNKKSSELSDVAIKGLTHEHNTGTIIETSWVENKLIFQDESFEDISHQLERWYGVTIVFKNNQLKENHLTGNFKNETIRQALDALKLTASFKYEIDKNNNITIY
jgi:transmembrane sensor